MARSFDPSRLRRLTRDLAAGAAMAMVLAPAHADPIPAGWTASNMQPVGYTGLDGHISPFKLSIKKSGERWYLYSAHSRAGGLSIIDVTDPTRPQPVNFLPGPPNTDAGQVSLHGDLLVWGMSRPLSPALLSGGVARQRAIEPPSLWP